jgi:predicted nuclease of restriction endonuclease-like (RecB) superfamily
VSPLATQLSWSHFVEILPLKTREAKLYYLEEAARGVLGKRGLRELINRKAYERRDIANAQLSSAGKVPFNVFKDPYLLDSLGLDDDFAEDDLESAILKEIEKFILEFGKGFAFVEKQKRMIIDGEDFHLEYSDSRFIPILSGCCRKHKENPVFPAGSMKKLGIIFMPIRTSA